MGELWSFCTVFLALSGLFSITRNHLTTLIIMFNRRIKNNVFFCFQYNPITWNNNLYQNESQSISLSYSLVDNFSYNLNSTICQSELLTMIKKLNVSNGNLFLLVLQMIPLLRLLSTVGKWTKFVLLL